MSLITLLLPSVALLYLLQKGLGFWKAIQSIQNHPGVRVLFSPRTIPGAFLRRIPGFTPGSNFVFEDKHAAFAVDGWDIRTLVSVLPEPEAIVFLADAAAIKEVSYSRARFPKPIQLYDAVRFYGNNIIASEGDEWKKIRKIAAPAFSDRNNKLVWEETINIINSLFNEVWKDRSSITVDHCVDITLPIALFVIGVAGFGRRVSWEDDDTIPAGHAMTFKGALHVQSKDFYIPMILPKWAMGITKRTCAAGRSVEELKKYMAEMIEQRLQDEKIERHDLFSSLLEANSEAEDGFTLTESEVMANIFIFLLAGHETTAHTLAFTFGLLALYPDEQEKLYHHIKSVLRDGREPTYEDMNSLTYSMAVLNETLRMFPPITGIPKQAAEDTVLTTSNLNGDIKNVVVPKGTYVAISIPGLHYNPRYWSDPEEFQPSRFLKPDWPRDAFLPFGSGPRACIGRKFSETEGIAILTMLVSRYKISVKEEPQFSKETFADRKARIFTAKGGISLAPIRISLVFTRR
ncbi:cytochrome P450 [Panaeolus papilionaceus]|nr:cytochrome P450 [Panaeolus papilionaceus]